MMRRGLLPVAVVAFLLLAMGWLANFDSLDNYAPAHHLMEWAYLFAATYVLGAYRVARIAERSALRRMLYLMGGMLFTTIAALLAYHAQHPGLADSGWSWRSPYHVQLAAPVLLGLFLGAAIVAIAIRLERSPARA